MDGYGMWDKRKGSLILLLMADHPERHITSPERMAVDISIIFQDVMDCLVLMVCENVLECFLWMEVDTIRVITKQSLIQVCFGLDGLDIAFEKGDDGVPSGLAFI